MSTLKIQSFQRWGILLLSLFLALPAAAEETWDWPRPKGERLDKKTIARCANPREGEGGVDAHVRVVLRHAATLQAEEALVQLERARRRKYEAPLSRPLLDWQIAIRLTELKRYPEAIERLAPLVEIPYFLRAQTDLFRESLARLHLVLGEPEQALAWLEPVIDPDCNLPRQSAQLLAVDLHLQAGRFEEALVLLERVGLAPTDKNQSWVLTRIDLIARLRGIEAAADATLRVVASPLRGTELSAALAPIIAQLAKKEASRPKLLAAVEMDLLDEQFGILPPAPYTELEPVSRRVPYPFKAENIGMPGTVTVLVKVNPEGGVEAIKILEASPPGFFEDAVISSAQKWTFTPQLVDGKPVTAYRTVDIKFRMRD